MERRLVAGMTARAARSGSEAMVTKSLLDGPATLAQLRVRTGLTRRSAWGALSRLLSAGLVGSAEDNNGRRYYRVR